MTTSRICLVEDDPIMGESLVERFRLEGFEIDWHTGANAARDAIRVRNYATVISDVRLPDMDGDVLYQRMVAEGVGLPPFILMTAYATVERAVSMLKMGVSDYVTKPFDLTCLVDTVRDLTTIRGSTETDVNENALGISAAAKELTSVAPRIAGRASSILITGESGVGKEVLARHIHDLANREKVNRPFVAVNCGAIAPTLAEAEFFGFERGAFTGADRQKRGYFEQADGGTLFLDEVGELTLSMQAALLRALQEKKVRRIGAERDIAARFELVCATNRDLAQMVQERLFREDLYYRINVVALHVKPLRERHEDILWFARRFMLDIAAQLAEPVKALHPLAKVRMLEHGWPGNIRELHNRIEHACLVCSAHTLTPSDIFPGNLNFVDASAGEFPAADATLTAYQDACERLYIQETLMRHGGRISETASTLKISRKNLWEKMKRHKIDSGRGLRNGQ